MRLLQSTWAELLTLTTAYRSLEQFADGRESNDIDGGENGLKLRYANDYWLDEQLARECCSVAPVTTTYNTTTTTSSSTTSITTASATPTVLDIYNLVSTR